MELDQLLSISGIPGLHKMVANRSNGLVVEDIAQKKRRFCSIRKHQFTPLGSISIYTMTDTVPLKSVFAQMHEKVDSMPDAKSEKGALIEYFSTIIPDFDRDRVYASDIKKLIKWYRFLTEQELLAGILAADDASSEEE